MQWIDFRGRMSCSAKDMGNLPGNTREDPLVFVMVPDWWVMPLGDGVAVASGSQGRNWKALTMR